MSTEDIEPEYYEMTPCEHVYTTHSGRKVYSTQHLVVPIPDNNEDARELADFDSKYGKDCMDGLSECSHTNESNSDPNEEEDTLSYQEDDKDTESVMCESSEDEEVGKNMDEEEEDDDENSD